jgi:hypothetical protein
MEKDKCTTKPIGGKSIKITWTTKIAIASFYVI